jgi:mitochondrial fusion and transport protein UGO1
VKLPLETVLRRGHISYLSRTQDDVPSPILPLHTAGISRNKFRTIVPVGSYRGIVGTMVAIVYEEGFREHSVHARNQLEKRVKRGQGMKGLWRGWRVGFWALVGMWTAMSLGGSGSGGEL